MRVLFLAGFGLLPLWVAIFHVYTESLKRGPGSDYMSAAPWLVFYSVFLCGVTYPMAAFTLRRYDAAEGGWPRKLLIGAATLLACLALLAGAIALFKYSGRDERAARDQERALAKRAAVDSPLVQAAAGPSIRAAHVTVAIGQPARFYEVVVQGNLRRALVVVRIERPFFAGAPRVEVACVDPPRQGVSPDPCR